MAHNPNLLRYRTGEELIEKICEDARRCLPIESCFVKNGVKLNTYRQWRRWYREEVEEGLEDTPIINLFSRVYQAERESEAVILDIEVDHALNGSLKATQHLLDNRFGYGKKKSEVELNVKEDTPIKFEIVDMKPLDNDVDE